MRLCLARYCLVDVEKVLSSVADVELTNGDTGISEAIPRVTDRVQVCLVCRAPNQLLIGTAGVFQGGGTSDAVVACCSSPSKLTCVRCSLVSASSLCRQGASSSSPPYQSSLRRSAVVTACLCSRCRPVFAVVAPRRSVATAATARGAQGGGGSGGDDLFWHAFAPRWERLMHRQRERAAVRERFVMELSSPSSGPAPPTTSRPLSARPASSALPHRARHTVMSLDATAPRALTDTDAATGSDTVHAVGEVRTRAAVAYGSSPRRPG